MMKNMKIIVVALLCCSTFPAQALDIASPDTSFIYSFDKNDDNKLSQKEFLSIRKSSDNTLAWDFLITQDSFKKLDRNKNGFLDGQDELPIDYTQEFYDYILCWPQCE